jgi:hypothetical protein
MPSKYQAYWRITHEIVTPAFGAGRATRHAEMRLRLVGRLARNPLKPLAAECAFYRSSFTWSKVADGTVALRTSHRSCQEIHTRFDLTGDFSREHPLIPQPVRRQ